MRDVLGAASRHETAYVGAGPAETLKDAADWRRLLDLLDQRGGATRADQVFRRWVVTDDQAKVLDERAAAGRPTRSSSRSGTAGCRAG
jgi:hypothetical protein